MGTSEFTTAGGNPAMDWHPIQGGVAILLVASCYGDRDKLQPDGPLGSYADFFLPLLFDRHVKAPQGQSSCYPVVVSAHFGIYSV